MEVSTAGKAAVTATARTESLSDGTFAIVITLLVLEIHRPDFVPGRLAEQLWQAWPSYLAYGVAFVYVGVIWLNHHYVFQHVRKADLMLHLINLGILGTSSLIPFPTGVLANAFREGTAADQKAAVLLYALIAGLMSMSWLPLFVYLHRRPQLLEPDAPFGAFAAQVRRPIVGIVLYIVSSALGWVFHPAVAVSFFVLVVAYYAWTSQGVRHRGKQVEHGAALTAPATASDKTIG